MDAKQTNKSVGSRPSHWREGYHYSNNNRYICFFNYLVCFSRKQYPNEAKKNKNKPQDGFFLFEVRILVKPMRKATRCILCLHKRGKAYKRFSLLRQRAVSPRLSGLGTHCFLGFVSFNHGQMQAPLPAAGTLTGR